MFKKSFLKISALIFIAALGFIFVQPANTALETQLLVDVSPSTDSVPYTQTQWYGFNAVANKGYCVILSPLTGNSDLYLFDTSFNGVGNSKNTGTTQDRVWYGQSSSGPMHIGSYGTYNPSSNFTVQVITAPYVKTISPASGKAGTLVTLTGFGFGDARGTNYVKFGTVTAASYYSWTNTQIKVYVPSGVANGVVQAVVYVASRASNPINFTNNNVSSDGTMYKYDLGRTNNYLNNGPSTLPLQPKWQYSITGYIENFPVVANNLVYFTVLEISPTGNEEKLFAVDATTGSVKWSFTPNIYQYFGQSIPAVAGGTLYIVGTDTPDESRTYPAMLFAFDANTGVFKWKYNAGIVGTIDYSTPAVFNNVVYFPVGATLYAVDASNGTLKWKYATQNTIYTVCTISNGIVYVGGGWNGSQNSKLYALDAVTGALKWIYTVSENKKIIGGTTVVNGVLYFGTGSNGTLDGAIYALSADTGVLKWRSINCVDASVAAVANGIVYANVNSGGWTLHAFDANTGVEKWCFKGSNGFPIVMSREPIISNGLMFVVGNSNTLYVADATTGAIKWSGLGDGNGFGATGPIAYKGKVYVLWHDTLYCFGQ
jgi:outer membrane protein assembly factor BamB